MRLAAQRLESKSMPQNHNFGHIVCVSRGAVPNYKTRTRMWDSKTSNFAFMCLGLFRTAKKGTLLNLGVKFFICVAAVEKKRLASACGTKRHSFYVFGAAEHGKTIAGS
jgi:hypothetical protein